ncbi:MAG: tripartite tricarboxylate transporter substrate binding protein [Pseudomonadota bacterium]
MRKIISALAATCVGAGLLLSIASSAMAQAYPSKPITLIVGTAPGGGYDLVARRLERAMSKQLGQSIVVANRPGSGSLVGTMAALQAPPDGYTLTMGGLSNIAFNAALYKKLPYDPLNDFTAIGIAAESPYVMIARRDLPVTDMANLIKYARANPGKLNVATAGQGTGQHVLAAAFLKETGLHIIQVPYQGAQPVYTDMLGGRIDLFIDSLPSARRFIESNQVNAFFVTGTRRDATLTAIPTAREAGFPGLEMTTWFGLFAPSKIPQEAIQRLNKAMEAALADEDLRKELSAGGFDPKPWVPPAETARYVKAEYTKWTKVIKDAGITLD